MRKWGLLPWATIVAVVLLFASLSVGAVAASEEITIFLPFDGDINVINARDPVTGKNRNCGESSSRLKKQIYNVSPPAGEMFRIWTTGNWNMNTEYTRTVAHVIFPATSDCFLGFSVSEAEIPQMEILNEEGESVASIGGVNKTFEAKTSKGRNLIFTVNSIERYILPVPLEKVKTVLIDDQEVGPEAYEILPSWEDALMFLYDLSTDEMADMLALIKPGNIPLHTEDILIASDDADFKEE